MGEGEGEGKDGEKGFWEDVLMGKEFVRVDDVGAGEERFRPVDESVCPSSLFLFFSLL